MQESYNVFLFRERLGKPDRNQELVLQSLARVYRENAISNLKDNREIEDDLDELRQREYMNGKDLNRRQLTAMYLASHEGRKEENQYNLALVEQNIPGFTMFYDLSQGFTEVASRLLLDLSSVNEIGEFSTSFPKAEPRLDAVSGANVFVLLNSTRQHSIELMRKDDTGKVLIDTYIKNLRRAPGDQVLVDFLSPKLFLEGALLARDAYKVVYMKTDNL